MRVRQHGIQIAEHKTDGSALKSPTVPAPPKEESAADLQRGYIFMVLLALQYGWQPLLTKECIGPDVQKSSIVIVQEVGKLAMALGMMFSEGGMAAWSKAIGNANGENNPWTILSSAKMALPLSCMYGIQNWLLFYSAGNMDPLSFNLVNQSKLIWTAFFLFMVMQRKQSPQQIIAICMMMFSATLLSMKASGGEDKSTDFFHGVVPNLGAALISGLAAAYSQKSMQGVGRNAYLFTMELCVWQTAFMFCITPIATALYSASLDADAAAAAATAAATAAASGNAGFFSGWFWYTPLPIFNNAAGGIFTGQVIKFAGGVRKGFAVVGALILTCVFQRLYYGTALTQQLYIALPCCVLANVIYSKFPYKAPATSN